MGVMGGGGGADPTAIRILAGLLGFPDIQIVKEITKPEGRERGGPRKLYVDFDTRGAMTPDTAIQMVPRCQFRNVHKVR